MRGSQDGVLDVHLLGPVEVHRHGIPIELGGPQQRAVLAHLALDAGRVVSVERLVDRLWGDEVPKAPLGTLQSYVSRLRRALEPDRGPGAAPQVLVSEAPGYVLRMAEDQVDVHRFRRLVAEGRTAAAEGRTEAAVTAFDTALALWRGPALAGVGPDDQVRPVVVRLDEERAAAEEDRFAALLALGRHGDVTAPLQALADDHPTREGVWALLALALYRSSRQADALRALATIRAHLRDELGLDPGPGLQDLEQRILRQDPSLLAPVAVTGTVESVAVSGPSADEHLVGRSDEWAVLTDALARAADGGARFVVVDGEPGIGKSTLLDAIAAHAARTGWRTAVGRCPEPGLAPSLWPWIEVARAVITTQADTVADADPWRSLASDADDTGPAHSAVELADRFVALLDRDDGDPWLIVLDDLHWADRATLDLARLVLERLGDRTVVVVGAHRPIGSVPDAALDDVLGLLRRAAPTDTVRLRPLDADEVARLMELTTGVAPTAAVASRVRDRAGGNPLFVTELARLAGERGLADDEAVPEAVRDVVRSRLAQLPARATAELEVAAVLGERFDLRTVMAASERDADACLDALDAAVVTRIVIPDGDGFRFAHALVRDAVLADVAPLRLARLHHRAAEAIVAVRGDGPDEAEPVAHHRIAAVACADPLVAATAAVRASDVARWRGSLDAADHFADRALRLVAQVPRAGSVDDVEIRALEALVDVSRRRLDAAYTAAVIRRVDEVAERGDNDAAAALSIFLNWGDIDETDDLSELEDGIRRAQVLLARTGDPYAVMVTRFMLACWELLRGRPVAADEHVHVALATAETARAADPPAHVPQIVLPVIAGMTAAVLGHADEARADMHELAPRWLAERRTVDPTAGLALRFNRALVEAMLGHPDAVLAELDERSGFDVPTFVLILSATCEILHGWARAVTGDRAGADAAIEAIAVVERGPERILGSCLRTFVGHACLAAGDERAIEFLADARVEGEGRGEVWWLAETIRLQAAADTRFADGGRADTLLDEAEAIAVEQGADEILGRIRADRVSRGTSR